MNKKSNLWKFVVVVISGVLVATSVNVDAQRAKPKMATDIPVSITTPDSVKTRLGTLKFFDGFPDTATVQRVYDNLDFQRGVQVFLTALPVACFYGLRSGIRTFGPDNITMLISEKLVDSRTLILPSNTETIYNMAWLDSKAGPVIFDLPQQMLGFVQDFWGRCVSDIGLLGPDKGSGGKYILLPPGYTGTVPEGYFVLHSRTFGNFIFMRCFLENGDPRPGVDKVKKNFRIYPLARAANPPSMNFVNISGLNFNTIEVNDATLFDQVAQVVRDEPLDAVDPETRGLLAAIGIRKDKPFAPDARMKRILSEAATVGNATVRTLSFSTRDKTSYYYPGSAWKAHLAEGDPEFSPGGVLNTEAKIYMFYTAWGMTPAMSLKLIGKGSQYAIADHDATGQFLDGSRNYRLHMPPNIPAKNFWSLVVYDPQTRSMLQTDQQFPSCSSLKKDIMINSDTSVDIYFGPKAPPGKEPNWIQTIPGKGWFTMLRLYGPLEPWFDKTWRIGEILLSE